MRHTALAATPPAALQTLLKAAVMLALVALLTPHAAATSIVEVYYNAPGGDNNKEFVEVFTSENLTGWRIGDRSGNDSLNPIHVNKSSNRSIIVEEGFDYSGLTCNVYSAGAAIGNGLGNTGDEVMLFTPNGTRRTSMEYNASAAPEGYAVVWNDGWRAGERPGGTPCLPEPRQTGTNRTGNRSAPERPTPDLLLELLMTSSSEGESPTLFRVTNRSYRTGGAEHTYTTSYWAIRNGSLVENRTEVLAFKHKRSFGTLALDQGNYTLCAELRDARLCANHTVAARNCNVTFALETPTLIETGETITLDHTVTGIDTFTIEYAVANLFGEVFVERTTRNANQKRFTPAVDELAVFRVRSELASACGSIAAERLVIVQGTRTEPRSSSGISIEDVDGETPLLVDAALYRGDTAKRVVRAWVENEEGTKVSTETKLSLEERFLAVELQFPISLLDAFKGDEFTLILEGLGERATQPVALTPPSEEQPCPTCICPEPLANPIASFYTRVQKPGEEGKLFARLVGANLTYELLGPETIVNGTATSGETLNWTVPFAPGRNLFVLKVSAAGGSDERSLVITRPTAPTTQSNSGSSPADNRARQDKESTAGETSETATETAPEAASETESETASEQNRELLTGEVVYERDNGLHKAPLVLGLAGATGAGAVLIRSLLSRAKRVLRLPPTRVLHRPAGLRRKLFKESRVPAPHAVQEEGREEGSEAGRETPREKRRKNSQAREAD